MVSPNEDWDRRSKGRNEWVEEIKGGCKRRGNGEIRGGEHGSKGEGEEGEREREREGKDTRRKEGAMGWLIIISQNPTDEGLKYSVSIKVI